MYEHIPHVNFPGLSGRAEWECSAAAAIPPASSKLCGRFLFGVKVMSSPGHADCRLVLVPLPAPARPNG